MSIQVIGQGSNTTVAAVYSNCFKQLNSTIAHLDLAKLPVGVLSRFSIQKLRYILWGESVGLVHRDSKEEQIPDCMLGDSTQQFKLSRILEKFYLDLKFLQDTGLDYGLLQITTPTEQAPQALKIFDQIFERFIERLTTQSQEDQISGPKWVIDDPEYFTATIFRKLLVLVDALEEITAAIEPIEAQHARIKAEIMSISDLENLRLIRDAANGWYPYLYESAVDRLAAISGLTEGMFPLTWTDSIATTMRGQSNHTSDYSIMGPSTTTFRDNLLRGIAIARSAVPTFRLGRPSRQLHAHNEETAEEETAEEESPAILKKAAEVERHKIVLLGEQCVGKTALALMFCRRHYVIGRDPTIEDSYSKSAVVDGRQCILEILDTSGDDIYATLRPGWISSGGAFMLVYSIHDYSTFITARKNRRHVYGKAAVIVGSSYTDETETVPRKRVVSVAEGLALAQELNCGFIEVSARDEQLVERAFNDVVRELRKRACEEKEEHLSYTL